jgi:hypothetical protein
VPLAATNAGRRVGRVRIRASADETARHAAILLADALSTASLPGADSQRLVVIRRLALGRIPARASAASIALLIERAARDAASEAVSADATSVDSAPAVAFRDRAQALAMLARALASGGPRDHWFWPRIVRGWTPHSTRAEQWIRLLDAAHEAPEATLLAMAIVEEAMRGRAEDDLLASLPRGVGARWLRLEGWADIAPSPATRLVRLPTRVADVARRQEHSPRVGDDRLVWLATILTCLERPTAVADPHLPSRVAATLLSAGRSTAAPLPSRRTTEPAPEVGDAPRIEQPDPAITAAEPSRSGSRDERADVAGLDSEARPDRVPVTLARMDTAQAIGDRVDIDHATAVPWHAPDGFLTDFAGLYFVVPILQRLDIAGFLAAHPALADDDFPARLLRVIARCTGLPETDPLAHAFDADLDANDPARAGIAWRWPSAVQRELTAPVPRLALSSPSIVWLTAVRRWCRRRARIGLVTLVRRPGRMHVSRTHVETTFALSQLDIRVRRAALDVDPGWVPWLHRVVQFRYGDDDQ